MRLYSDFLKVLFDKTAALIILILLSPILLLISIILVIQFRGNPFFLQPRIGYKNKIFKIIKFRKMTDETDEYGNLLPEDQRLTKFGQFIQRSSLDEIPQLINVLIGQMSIIGPRPLLVENFPYYTPRELHRHDVKPGITGLAQVKARHCPDWNKRLEYDIKYIENLSFGLDIKILFFTVYTVLRTFFSKKNKVEIYSEPYIYRAYIRLINENDDKQEIANLLKKGSCENINIESDQHLIFIDDYKGRYNSFFCVKLNNTNPQIIDYYIGDETFLSQQLMYDKYIEVIKKYLSDLGYPQELKI